MCSISGIFNLDGPSAVPERLLRQMIAIQGHRGPDESGLYIDQQIGLGHGRLSIVGLDGGTQPIGTEDGSLWIVFNGEAFNYPELKRDLEGRGHRFATTTDTEVVLHLYEEFGVSALERINGQFALAIWDSRRRELFLARDRVGVRPLHFARCGSQLLFASEIKAIFLHPRVRREIAPEALAQVFTFWTTLPSATLFRDVHELPPGHLLRVRDGQMQQECWWQIPWQPPEEKRCRSLPEAREELANLLTDAVRLRLRADVPVGAYLSGGLDSSILTVLAADIEGRSDLRTFSLGFAEAAYDETSFQSLMAQQLGTRHQLLTVNAAGVRRHLPEVVWHCEKPMLRTAPVPLYLLSRLVQESGLKVVLTGEGADEVFAGYNIFKETKVRRFWSRQPDSSSRPLLLERLYPYVFANPSRERHFLRRFFAPRPGEMEDPCFSHRIRWEGGMRNQSFFSAAFSSANQATPILELARFLPQGFAAGDDVSRAQWLEMAIFLSAYLLSSQGDRVAMAHGVELRHPFLDYRLIEFGFRLPPHWRLRGLNEKYLLKQTFAGRLPAAILKRPKQPYRAPIREIFQGGEDSLLNELLTVSSLRRTGLFEPERVASLVHRFRHGRPDQQSELQNMAMVGIATTQLVHHQFIEGAWLREVPAKEPDLIIRWSAARRPVRGGKLPQPIPASI